MKNSTSGRRKRARPGRDRSTNQEIDRRLRALFDAVAGAPLPPALVDLVDRATAQEPGWSAVPVPAPNGKLPKD